MIEAAGNAWGFDVDALEDRIARRCYLGAAAIPLIGAGVGAAGSIAGGAMGGGQSSTNTIQKSDPWSQQQPYLEQQFQQAANLYGNYTPSYYPNRQVAPLNDVQRASLGNIEATGLGGTPALNAAQGAITNLVGGQMPGQQAAANNFGGANSAIANNLGGAGIGGMMPAYTAMQGGLQNLSGGGGRSAIDPSLAAFNPFLTGQSNAAVAPSQNALSQFLNPNGNAALTGSVAASVLPQIESQFGSAGGMSNPNAAYAASSGLASALAPYTLQAAQQQAQTAMGEQGLTQQAAQAAGQLGMGEQGIQLGASGLTNQAMLAQQALQQQAAQQASQNYYQGQGQQILGSQLAPGLNAATMGNLQSALGAGGMSQQQQQAYINAAMNAWNYNTMLPYNKLGMFGNEISGNFGGTTNLQQPYFNNPIGQGLSGLVGGASLANSLKSAGLFGGAAGGGLGAADTMATLGALGLQGSGGLAAASPGLGMLFAGAP